MFDKRVLLGCALCLGAMAAMPVAADTIYGKMKFSKKPPHAAVIYMRDDQAEYKTATIDQIDRKFTKKLSVASEGSKVLFLNSDKFQHNLFANNYQTQTEFDVGLIPPGNEIEIDLSWPLDTMVRVGCKIHPSMRTYVANIQSDNFEVVDFVKDAKARGGYEGDSGRKNSRKLRTKKGTYKFQMTQVPESLGTVSVLLPHYDLITVDLKRGEKKTVDLVRRGKKRGEIEIARRL